jgi:hypothetical protein
MNDTVCDATDVRDVPGATDAGRRIYVHEESFTHLAHGSADAAMLVYGLLGRVAALKLTHHVIEDFVGTGGTMDGSDALLDAVNDAWSPAVTKAMRAIGVNRGGATTPLLDPSESVAATCYFSNYFTFATNAQSAREMYRDDADIATIRKMQSDGTGYRNLTLLNGHCLVLPHEQRQKLPPAAAGEIRRRVLESLQAEMEDVFGRQGANGELLDRARAIVQTAFSRGMLKSREL